MTYNLDELTEGGQKAIKRCIGTVVLSEGGIGTYGEQHVISLEDLVVLESEEPVPFDRTNIYYKKSTRKRSTWAVVLRAYTEQGIPLPAGPLGKRIEFAQGHIVFKGKDAAGNPTEMIAKPLLPVAIHDKGEATPAVTTEQLQLLAGLITTGEAITEAMFKQRAALSPDIRADAGLKKLVRGGKAVETLVEAGLVKTDSGAITRA